MLEKAQDVVKTCERPTVATWDDFEFWQSGEWQKIEEDLDVFDQEGVKYNPRREDLFASLDAVPFNSVRVAILGQDPYPEAKFATGIAFSIPRGEKTFPPTLVNIFKEYVDDLHYEFPKHGDLKSWCKQGVLLFNCIPSCYPGKPGSHRGWTEWNYLTKEVIFRLGQKGIIFVTLGGIARMMVEEQSLDETKNIILSYSHPSPLGASKSKSPFFGSRLFSTINTYLSPSIDWRL